MGVLTISVNDETEEILRRIAIARFNKRKGYLSMAITEAVNEWAAKERNEDISKGLELLKKGIRMGGIVNKKREDWHKR